MDSRYQRTRPTQADRSLFHRAAAPVRCSALSTILALRSSCRRIELGLVVKDSHLIEGLPPFGLEVGCDLRALRDAIMQRDHEWEVRLEARHRIGKGVAQALDDVECREVHVR